MGDINTIVNLWEELQQHFLLNKDTINKLQLETNSNNLSKLQRYQEYTAQQLEQLGALINQLIRGKNLTSVTFIKYFQSLTQVSQRIIP